LQGTNTLAYYAEVTEREKSFIKLSLGRFHDYATLGNPRLSPGGSRGSSASGPSSVVSAPPPVVTYPMYHTCERQKKRVTIMEDNNTESSV